MMKMKTKKTGFWNSRQVGPIEAIHPMTGKTITVYPQRDARIGSDLDLEWRRWPGLLSWWIALRDTAKKHLDRVMHEEHNISEDLYEEYRGKVRKSATETSIKMAVKRDSRMREAFRARMDAEDMHRRIASQVEAIAGKQWALKGLVETAAQERGAKDHA